MVGFVWVGMVRVGMVWVGMVRVGMVWVGIVWVGMVWAGMVWVAMLWVGTVWVGMKIGRAPSVLHLSFHPVDRSVFCAKTGRDRFSVGCVQFPVQPGSDRLWRGFNSGHFRLCCAQVSNHVSQTMGDGGVLRQDFEPSNFVARCVKISNQASSRRATPRFTTT